MLTRDRWFTIGLAVLLLIFAILLIIQPSAVGRGGR